jgi:NAD+ kinase
MSSLFNTIGIIGKPGDPNVKQTVRALSEHLLGLGLEVLAEIQTRELLKDGNCSACALASMGEKCQLVIIIGGDGTFLGAARALAAGDVPLLGINLGRLGFLVDISPPQMLEAVDRVLAGDFDQERRFLLSSRTAPPGATAVTPALAFNDVVLHKWNSPRMVEFETYIDGQFVNAQRSDGMIVSTPTGSTAYALSGGGPLLQPSLDALLLVPICPHTLSNRPIVVAGDSRVEIRIRGQDHAHVHVSCDGQNDKAIQPGENLYIEKYEHRIRLLHPKGHDHFSILRAKLGWGGHLTL